MQFFTIITDLPTLVRKNRLIGVNIYKENIFLRNYYVTE